jgi:hypothetical protein
MGKIECEERQKILDPWECLPKSVQTSYTLRYQKGAHQALYPTNYSLNLLQTQVNYLNQALTGVNRLLGDPLNDRLGENT